MKSSLMAWASQHPVATWALAWGATGIGLELADVFSEPRRGGPFWIAVVAGFVAWAVAGAATFSGPSLRPTRTRPRDSALAWGTAYLVALALGAVLGDWFERHTIGSLSSAGFVGMLLGWSAAAGAGALVSTWRVQDSWNAARSISFAAVWAFGFLLAGYLGLVAALVMGQLARGVLRFLVSQHIAFLLGWGAGCALGGLVAAAFGIAVGRVVLGNPSAAGS